MFLCERCEAWGCVAHAQRMAFEQAPDPALEAACPRCRWLLSPEPGEAER